MNKIDVNNLMKAAGSVIYGYFRNHELPQDEAIKFIEKVFNRFRDEAQILDDLTDEDKPKPTLKNRKKVNFDNKE